MSKGYRWLSREERSPTTEKWSNDLKVGDIIHIGGEWRKIASTSYEKMRGAGTVLTFIGSTLTHIARGGSKYLVKKQDRD